MADAGIGSLGVRLSLDSAEFSAGLDRAAAISQREMARIERATAAAKKEGDRYLASLQRQVDTFGLTGTALQRYEANLKGVSDKAGPLLDRLEAMKKAAASADHFTAGAKALNQFGVSAGQTAAAMRTLPAQFTDIATQLQGGANPLTILLQQGGQIKDSFGGVRPALAALATYVTPVSVAVTGLAAAVGGAALAFVLGQQEAEKLARSIVLTGNFAGITAGQFDAMAHQIGERTKAGVGVAREALEALVASGDVGPRVFAPMGAAVTAFANVSGESATKVAADFVRMGDGVAKWALEHNKSLNFINTATYERIKALEDAGQKEQAELVVLDALNNRLDTMAGRMGYLAQRWNELGQAAAWAWGQMKSAGAADTVEAEIAKVDARLAEMDAKAKARRNLPAFSSAPEGRGNDTRAQAQAERNALVAAQDQEQQNKQINAYTAAAQKAGMAASDMVDKWDKQAKGLSVVNSELERYRAQVAKVNLARSLTGDAPVPADQVARAEAQIRKQFAAPAGPKPPKVASQAAAIDQADLGFDLAGIKAQLDARNSVYRNAEALLSAQRQAGFVDEKSFYERKRELIEASAASEVFALDQERARLQAQTFSGATAVQKRIDNEKKLAEVVARTAKVEQDARTQVAVLDVQREGSLNAVKRGYEEARIAAQAYLDTAARQQNRDVEAFGQGDKARSANAARAQIEDRYQGERNSLEANKQLLELEGKFTDESRKQYEQRLALLDEFQGKALAQWEGYYERIRAAERDWTNGAGRALANYQDQTANAAAYAERFTTGSLGQLEDAIVKFSRTGKLNLGSLWQFMADEFLRQQARMVVASATGQGGWLSSIFSAVGSYFGGGKSTYGSAGQTITNPSDVGYGVYAKGGVFDRGEVHAFAAGGVVDKATPFRFASGAGFSNGVMGEAGPEAVMPLKRGSDGKLGVAAQGVRGGGDLIVNIHNNAGAQVETRETRRPDGGRSLEIFVEKVKRAVAQDIQGGGDVASAMQGTYGLNRAAGVMRGG